MKKILEMLYNGEIDPGEVTVPQDENYRLVARKIADEQDYFKQNLSEEDAERFEELKESLSIFSCMHSYANFEYGFKLAVLLMNEIWSSNTIVKEEIDRY